MKTKYEQSAAWNAYYRETDPQVRRQRLTELIKTEPDDGANALRKRLFDLRHPDGAQTDLLLWQCVNFIQIYETSRLFKAGARKEVRSSLEKTGAKEAAAWGEAGQKALYWEYRNALQRYLITTTVSGYRRALFGLIGTGEADRGRQVCKDVWEMSAGLAKRLDLKEELAVWIRAVADGYGAGTEGGASRLQEYDATH